MCCYVYGVMVLVVFGIGFGDVCYVYFVGGVDMLYEGFEYW